MHKCVHTIISKTRESLKWFLITYTFTDSLNAQMCVDDEIENDIMFRAIMNYTNLHIGNMQICVVHDDNESNRKITS
jgi:hypothetical protein